MIYKKFIIRKYRGISRDLTIDFSFSKKNALIGLNESGKSTILNALLVFDYYNDEKYNSKHLQNLNNYYNSISYSEEAEISAEIIVTDDDQDFKDNLEKKLMSNSAFKTEISSFFDEVKLEVEDNELYNSFFDLIKNEFIVTRIYKPNYTVLYKFENKLSYFSNNMAIEITKIALEYLPIFIFLNSLDNEINSKININSPKNEWDKTFNNVFIKYLNKSLKELISTPNQQAIKSTTLNVQEKLNKEFMNRWREFSIDERFADSLDLNLEIMQKAGTSEYELKVELREKVKNQESPNVFEISQRSDGFKWYYSFIMQLLFTPTTKPKNNGVIFLLDEPGLYLHPSAQTSLLKKIIKIINDSESKFLLYTTHSQHMLDISQEGMNIKNIFIAEKDKEKLISVYNVVDYKGNMSYEKKSPLEPVYESLHIPINQREIEKEKVLFVEGLYDYYALMLFTNLKEEMYIYPCRGASSIIDILPRFFAIQSKQCSFLVDNDREGIKELQKIREFYPNIKGAYLPFDGYNKVGPNQDEKVKSYTMNDTLKDKLVLISSSLNVEPKYENILLYMWDNFNDSSVKKIINDKEIKNIFTKISNEIHKSFYTNKEVIK
jgi:predicted ATP-dependent endonuclease of OLD family